MRPAWWPSRRFRWCRGRRSSPPSGRSANGISWMRASVSMSVHAGQPDIQQHQLEAPRAAARPGTPRRFPTACDRVAFVLQHAAQRLADPRLVVHHQNASSLHARTVTVGAALRVSAPLIAAGRNLDGEARARGWLSSTRIGAVVLGDDVADDRQAQSGAAALGRKVWQESFSLSSG